MFFLPLGLDDRILSSTANISEFISHTTNYVKPRNLYFFNKSFEVRD